MSELLTDQEHRVVRQLGEIWGEICGIVEVGPTTDHDLNELVFHIHALQKAIMGNAAARAYPDLYRRLGSVVQ